MIVVDTNVMAALIIGGPDWDEASRLYELDQEWAAPPLLLSELCNVLLGHLRRGAITRARAVAMIENATLVLGDRLIDAPHTDVIDVALNCGLTAYDAEFVVVARQLGVSLATADRAILRNASDVATLLSTLANREP